MQILNLEDEEGTGLTPTPESAKAFNIEQILISTMAKSERVRYGMHVNSGMCVIRVKKLSECQVLVLSRLLGRNTQSSFRRFSLLTIGIAIE